MTLKAFEHDGLVSSDHVYVLFEKDGEEMHFAFPKQVPLVVATAAAKALVVHQGWRYVDLEDRTYGQEPDEETLQGWRTRFLASMSTSCRSDDYASSWLGD